jgi:hypothetical protein
VLRRLIERETRNPFRRLDLRGARRLLTKRLAETIVRTMADDLNARGLLR